MIKIVLLLAIVATFSANLWAGEVVSSYGEILASVNKAQDEGYGDLICNYPKEDSQTYGPSLQSCEASDPPNRKLNRTCLVTELICQSPSVGQFVVNDVIFFIPDNEKCSDTNPSDAFRNSFRIDMPVKILGD